MQILPLWHVFFGNCYKLLVIFLKVSVISLSVKPKILQMIIFSCTKHQFKTCAILFMSPRIFLNNSSFLRSLPFLLVTLSYFSNARTRFCLVRHTMFGHTIFGNSHKYTVLSYMNQKYCKKQKLDVEQKHDDVVCKLVNTPSLSS